MLKVWKHSANISNEVHMLNLEMNGNIVQTPILKTKSHSTKGMQIQYKHLIIRSKVLKQQRHGNKHLIIKS